jgi:hypothetical protein
MSRDEPNSFSIPHAASLLILDGDSGGEAPSITAINGNDPLALDQGFDADTSEIEGKAPIARSSRSTGRKPCAVSRSLSVDATEMRVKEKTPTPTTTKPRIHPNTEHRNKCSNPGQRRQGLVRATCPTALRASSCSKVETRSRYHDLNITAADLQLQLVTRTKQVDQEASKPQRGDLTRSTSGPSNGSNTENSAPTFRWYARSQSNPDSDVSENMPQSKLPGIDAPLKPCLKTKAKSTTTSPPGELESAADDCAGDRTLRRVKTVDFEQAVKPLLGLPTPPKAPKKKLQMPSSQLRASLPAASQPAKSAYVVPSCPNMLSLAKSNLADPATTHADVHVIAIAPSRNMKNAANKANSDPATPTIQFVESNNGCYEVIWDDVPVQQSDQTRRRSSVATHSLQLADPAATRGLQRVNTKLADWSGSWNSLSDTFKPTVIVFPDHDTWMPHVECAAEDDEDMLAPAPPNSHRTSAMPSCVPSRPVSAPLTRAPSEEGSSLIDALQRGPSELKQEWVVPLEDSLLVSDPEIQSTRLLNVTQRLRSIPLIRKLSNVDDADLKFRGHRDSVTLTHTRLLHTGGVSPELFAHRDSVSVARKRMHARNHATSAAREIAVSSSKDYTSPLAMSLDDMVLDMPMVKQHAAQALRSQKSASMFIPQESEQKRHVRIVD